MYTELHGHLDRRCMEKGPVNSTKSLPIPFGHRHSTTGDLIDVGCISQLKKSIIFSFTNPSNYNFFTDFHIHISVAERLFELINAPVRTVMGGQSNNFGGHFFDCRNSVFYI